VQGVEMEGKRGLDDAVADADHPEVRIGIS
jgi:hypothetical protein